MKKLLFMLTAWLLLGSCHKDPVVKPVDYSLLMDISGKILDAQTRAPIPNIVVFVELTTLDLSDWSWYTNTLTTGLSDENGDFQLQFRLDDAFYLNLTTLKILSIPDGYQQGTRINGAYNSTACNSQGVGGYYGLKSNGFYRIEIFPQTKAYFVKPIVPEAWKYDTLEMTVRNLIETPGSQGWVCATDNAESYFNFRLNNPVEWLGLKKVRNLAIGDSLTIDYSIRNGGVKKSGTFGKRCQMGDTTAVELPFWQ